MGKSNLKSPSAVPALVKHVTMAIFAKPRIGFANIGSLVPPTVGKEAEHFVESFTMAVNALRSQGYLSFDSRAVPEGYITLTGRGVLRNKEHLFEGGWKNEEFNRLFNAAFSVQGSPPQDRDIQETQVGKAEPAIRAGAKRVRTLKKQIKTKEKEQSIKATANTKLVTKAKKPVVPKVKKVRTLKKK